MREIKFRAWDKDGEQMFYSDRQDIAGEPENIVLWNINEEGITVSISHSSHSLAGGEVTEEEYYRTANIELMQFTGLKDKNGKEIYEGDILGYWGDATWQVGWDSEKAKWAAVYFKTEKIPSTGESLVDTFAFGITKVIAEKHEIIGNIYENSELLK